MKRRNYKGRELLPLAVSDAARAGDTDAAEQVLRYYEGHINKLYPDGLRQKWLFPCLPGRVHEKPLGKQAIRAILGVN